MAAAVADSVFIEIITTNLLCCFLRTNAYDAAYFRLLTFC